MGTFGTLGFPPKTGKGPTLIFFGPWIGLPKGVLNPPVGDLGRRNYGKVAFRFLDRDQGSLELFKGPGYWGKAFAPNSMEWGKLALPETQGFPPFLLGGGAQLLCVGFVNQKFNFFFLGKAPGYFKASLRPHRERVSLRAGGHFIRRGEIFRVHSTGRSHIPLFWSGRTPRVVIWGTPGGHVKKGGGPRKPWRLRTRERFGAPHH